MRPSDCPAVLESLLEHAMGSHHSLRYVVRFAFMYLAATASATPALARPVHLWSIQEVYSNNTGSLQFIELVDNFGFNNATTGATINVFNSDNSQEHSFTLPGPDLQGNTIGHMLLFGTAGVHAAGGPTPDYTLPDGFLFTAGGTINYFALNGPNNGMYTALPTDGLLARDWQSGANVMNFSTNYKGESGSITPVPEPSVLVLTPLAIAFGMAHLRRSRWRALQAQPT
jgi:hypothetical protein